MPRIIPRFPLFRPLTRLGGFASRPILPLAANFSTPFRSHSRSPLCSPPGTLERNYFSSRTDNNTSPPNSPAPSDKLPENATVTQRLKYTLKKYGWYALGMYIFFSTLDFGITFAAINYLGAEYAAQLAENIKEALPWIFHPPKDPAQPEPSNSNREGLYAMLVLAYTIHKTLLLPFRVGMTAAFTPRFVNWLGRKGWAGSSGARRAMDEARQRLRRNSNSSEGGSQS